MSRPSVHKSFKSGLHKGRKHNHKHNMVLTSDARISMQNFSASEDGLDISKPCVLLMFVLLVMTGL